MNDTICMILFMKIDALIKHVHAVVEYTGPHVKIKTKIP